MRKQNHYEEGQYVEIIGIGQYLGKVGKGTVYRDMIILDTASVLYNYNDMFYKDNSIKHIISPSG